MEAFFVITMVTSDVQGHKHLTRKIIYTRGQVVDSHEQMKDEDWLRVVAVFAHGPEWQVSHTWQQQHIIL
jgi:hypothetical protein